MRLTPLDFSTALEEWHICMEIDMRRNLSAQERKATKRVADAEAEYERGANHEGRPRRIGECELCGFPAGQPGFVRFPWPVGHMYFGRLVRCPRCNRG